MWNFTRRYILRHITHALNDDLATRNIDHDQERSHVTQATIFTLQNYTTRTDVDFRAANTDSMNTRTRRKLIKFR